MFLNSIIIKMGCQVPR